jgi:hypothetical protein
MKATELADGDMDCCCIDCLIRAHRRVLENKMVARTCACGHLLLINVEHHRQHHPDFNLWVSVAPQIAW